MTLQIVPVSKDPYYPVDKVQVVENKQKIIVLKFGSSVLTKVEDVHVAVHEIYSHVRKGKSVVAVVSAIGGETDSLLNEAEKISECGRSRHLASLLATGEMRAASLLAMAVERVGLLAEVLNPLDISLTITGDHLDAEPVGVDLEKVTKTLKGDAIAIIPGFFGKRDDGKIGLLGRGGSDLTALFLAKELGAGTCKLVKDVDGVYSEDPNKSTHPVQKFNHLNWQDALNVSNELIQPKAIELSKRAGVSFEVGAIGSSQTTTVGDNSSSFHQAVEKQNKIRVALLGLGAVGGGVYQHLCALKDRGVVDLEVIGIAVTNIEKHHKNGLPESLLTDNAYDLISQNPDIIFESLSVCDVAVDLISLALSSGQHVISANKQAIVKLLNTDLGQKAQRDGQLRYSAAAAGGVPVLETLNHLKKGNDLVGVTGVLNGTTNFVLDRLAEGIKLPIAIKEAQDLGYAEADPTADIDGLDAEAKLKLIAYDAWGTIPDDVGIVCHPLSTLKTPKAEGDGIRQVATLSRNGSWVVGSVGPLILEQDDFLLGAKLAGNRVILTYQNGDTVLLDGLGAGRWPTAQSMIGDFLAD